MILPEHLVERFAECLEAARKAGEIEPTAMTLATLAHDGGVAARMVLLKDFGAEGFVFYTNLESSKGRQLEANPRVALVFFWKTTKVQVRIEGRVERVSDAEADAYFATRDRGSQLGAWASQQSRPLRNRAELIKRVARFEARYLGRPVPRPPHWSGLRVRAEMIEFWHGRKSRLHDRFRFTPGPEGWIEERLYP